MKIRASGVLMHVSSLPGKYGIGDFGENAYKFVDFIYESGLTYWQILPLGVTGYGDSPYQSFSAFAGNPYFIDLNELIEMGLIEKDDIRNYPLEGDKEKIDYENLYYNKLKILKIASENSTKELKLKVEKFYAKEKNWLREYTLFMSIKEKFDGLSWFKWNDEYKNINSSKVKEFEEDNKDKLYFHIFMQYFFSKQWKALKEYSNSRGIRIIGDLPIYVSEDSSDVWANKKLFKLDEDFKPVTVSGCPPDKFATLGQLWGNPIYDWEKFEKDGYFWWIKRLKENFKLYDTIRIDHFRGFESFWEIENGAKDATKGQWTKGPGMKLFKAIKKSLGDIDIIAEDLGFLTNEVKDLINKTGYPGMNVLQFAFESYKDSVYLPHNNIKNSVVYTGTHDNETILGWFENLSEIDKEFAKKYLKLDYYEGINWGLIRGAYSSPSFLAIIPMQDFLGLKNEARMNTPSTLGGNWNWRMRDINIDDKIKNKILDLNKIYGR